MPRGGRRPGAGRSPAGGTTVKRVTISLPAALLKKIDQLAYKDPGPGRSKVIADLVTQALEK
jgi:metal-responsive CopG/Arc/MetJ family transcriptional regulator